MTALALTAALFLHTDAELQDWYAEWLATPAPSNWKIAELVDMRGRHAAAAPTPSTDGPVAAAAAPFRGMGSNVEQWRSKVAYYFPADQVDRALRVMACESGGNPNAYNKSGASGLMQVLASWADNFGYRPSDLFDPDINLYVASLLYYDGGWAHWVCRG